MREQLTQYVELLFAGARDCEDIKQEILQNTLDRYDDLIAEGKVPEAAYRLAIAGIGDINEILGTSPAQPKSTAAPVAARGDDGDSEKKRKMQAIAVGLYIICILPLIALSESGLEILGLCITIIIVAIATVMMILAAKKDDQEDVAVSAELTPDQELRKSIATLVRTVSLVAFFVLSFMTGAWYITWLIFPIGSAVNALIRAILDLKEAVKYEN